MANISNVFLTGFTGTLGSRLCAELLVNGAQVFALVRGKGDQDAQNRVFETLKRVGVLENVNNVRVVCGDITEPKLLESPYFEELKACSMIIHCAASTEFSDTNIAHNQLTNVEGTRHVLALARRLAVPVVYVSTAYVCGMRDGVVRKEEYDLGQEFNNSYEKTKFQAEGMVRQWSKETGLPVIILRPSIVAGDSRDGSTVNFNAIYDFMHVFDVLAPRLNGDPIRVAVRPNVTKNIIPVDYFAKTALHIIKNAHQGTYHITHPEPITMAGLQRIFTELFGISRIKLVEESDFLEKKRSGNEKIFYKASTAYRPYMDAEPCFDRSETDKILAGSGIELPMVDLNYFEILLRYARLVDWGNGYKRGPADGGVFSSGVDQYFTDFLADKMHKLLLPDVRKFNACFSIQFNDTLDKRWSLKIEHGKLESISRNGLVVQCNYRVDRDMFCEIIAGRVVPQEAFFQRRIDIEGDIETGLMVATVLAEFFQKYPYEVQHG